MYDSYTEFQLNILEIQLMLADAELSDFDRQQNRVRSPDGRWTTSPSAMSDGEKLNLYLDKEQKVWKADTPERKEAIATIAKKLAGSTNAVVKIWNKITGGEAAFRDKLLKKLAPAVALSGNDLKEIDIDERERVISDLDYALQEVLSKREANTLITELILDVNDYEHEEMTFEAKSRATVSLDKTLSDLGTPIKSQTLKEVVIQTFKNAADGVIAAVTQKNMSDEEFYEGSRKKVQNEINRKEAQAETLEQLKRVGRNTQEMMNDIGSATIAGFEAATKAIGDAEKNMETVARDVADKVSSFFRDNIEAYYEGRSEVGKEKYKKVKAILDKAKAKNDNAKT